MKLVKNDMYLLLIDEEVEIKEGTKWVYDKDKPSITPLLGNTNIVKEGIIKGWFVKIIAYYPLTKEAKELDLPLLPSFQVDIEKLACEKYSIKEGLNDYDERYYNSHNVAKAEAFIDGYKASQSKQFTLEDMKKAIEMARKMDCSNFEYYGFCEKAYTDEEIIQSLSTQQLPSEFIPETYCSYGDDCPSKGAYDKQHLCNVKLKTITNSEGKQEIQGTYKY
jgi:hypothetical protein